MKLKRNEMKLNDVNGDDDDNGKIYRRKTKNNEQKNNMLFHLQ